MTFFWDRESAGSSQAAPRWAGQSWPDPSAAGARWVPLGEPVHLGGVSVDRGGVYVGEHLAPLDRQAPLAVAACLVRPNLEVDWKRPDDRGDVGFWPSYSRLPPRSRAGYLRFLAGGAQHPQAPTGFLFLYFYGLERRLLVNLARTAELLPTGRVDGAAGVELAALGLERTALLTEVERLLTVYERHYSVRRYATDLLRVSAWADAPQPSEHPDVGGINTRQVSAPLTLALGRLVARGKPVSAEWAWAWWRSHPATGTPVALRRCPEEFGDLFRCLYRQRHSDGLVLPAPSQALSIYYRAASPDLPHGRWVTTDAADVTLLAEPLDQLAAVAAEASSKLRRYSRYLATQGDQTPARTARPLLPPELQPAVQPDTQALVAWVRHRLGEQDVCTVDVRDLMTVWTGGLPGDLDTVDLEPAALEIALAGHGLQVQRDVRGPERQRNTTHRVALINSRCQLHMTGSAGPSGSLGALGEVDQARLSEASTVLETLIDLAAGSRALDVHDLLTLSAHASAITGLGVGTTAAVTGTPPAQLHGMALLMAERPLPATTLRRRQRALSAPVRRDLEAFIIGGKLDRFLTADDHDAFSQLQRLLRTGVRLRGASHAGQEGLDGLAAVKMSGRPGAVHALPEPPSVATQPLPRQAVALDPDRLQAVQRDTDAVHLLLAQLFRDEQDAPGRATSAVMVLPGKTPLTAPDSNAATNVGGREASPPMAAADDKPDALDTAHWGLLCDLNARSSWSRPQFDALASARGLLPAAALDHLNETALDLTGDHATEGHDPVTVNTDIIEEMREQHQHEQRHQHQ